MDIEEIVKPFWYKGLTDEATQKCYEFLDDYYYNKLPLNNDISKKFIIFQSANRLFIDFLQNGKNVW